METTWRDKHTVKPEKHYMSVKWHEHIVDGDVKVKEATLKERTMVIGRVGIMDLATGTSAWRVLDNMNHVGKKLGVIVTADIGLLSISFTCMEGSEQCSLTLSLPTTGINTERLYMLNRFLRDFDDCDGDMTLQEIHDRLDDIQHKKGNYSSLQVGFASGIACCGFTFLLGGGPIEMFCAFLGAGFGNFVRRLLIDRHISLIPNTVIGVSAACIINILAYRLLELFFGISPEHEAGYICAMLFIIPGFPLITGGIDLAKSHMRSGLERGSYAIMIITVATLTGWVVAQTFGFHPQDFIEYDLHPSIRIVLWLITSFMGVFGFSQMYDSPIKMAARAGVIGAIANTLRLILANYAGITPSIAALIGAFSAGLMAAYGVRRFHYPRITLSVPSIVIMVPGLFMYRAVYNFGIGEMSVGADWLIRAIFLVMALPLGLIFARILTDPRYLKSV